MLGVLAFQRGDIDGAHAIWEAALAEAERIGALPLQALLLSQLGEAARLIGAARRGAHALRRGAGAGARSRRQAHLVADRAPSRPPARSRAAIPKRALDHCERALELAEAAGIRVDVGRALLALGQVHAATLFDDTGDGERRAEDYFCAASSSSARFGNEAELASGLERFGKYRIERGDVDAGKRLLTEAEAIFRKLGMRAGDALRRVIGEL